MTYLFNSGSRADSNVMPQSAKSAIFLKVEIILIIFTVNDSVDILCLVIRY
jgi:hypothetical protein